MNPSVVKALADLALLLEHTGEQHLDPDIAIQAMEQMAQTLTQMASGDRAALAMAFQALSTQYSEPQDAAFVAALPEALGIV